MRSSESRQYRSSRHDVGRVGNAEPVRISIWYEPRCNPSLDSVADGGRLEGEQGCSADASVAFRGEDESITIAGHCLAGCGTAEDRDEESRD
jgi:hypothetical protein